MSIFSLKSGMCKTVSPRISVECSLFNFFNFKFFQLCFQLLKSTYSAEVQDGEQNEAITMKSEMINDL